MPDFTVVPSAQASPLSRLVEDYLMDCKARGLAPGTLSNSYGYPLRGIFLPWCADHGVGDLEGLDARTLNAFSVALAERKKKNGDPISRFSVHAYARAVRGFLQWCENEKERPKGEPKPPLPRLPRLLVNVLDRSEIDALEGVCPTERNRLIIRILGDLGLRADELCFLTTDDVRRRDRQAFLHVKGKRELDRDVPLPPALLRRVERYVRDVRPKDSPHANLFLSLRRGKSGEYEPLTTSGVLQMVKGAAKGAGNSKRVYSHLLRHSMITNALRAGMNPLLVQQVAGHSSLKMIEKVYSHLNRNDAYEAMIRTLSDQGGRPTRR